MPAISEELRSAHDETYTHLGVVDGLLTALEDVITECQPIAPLDRAHAIHVLIDCMRERMAKVSDCREAEWRAIKGEPKLVAAE